MQNSVNVSFAGEGSNLGSSGFKSNISSQIFTPRYAISWVWQDTGVHSRLFENGIIIDLFNEEEC